MTGTTNTFINIVIFMCNTKVYFILYTKKSLFNEKQNYQISILHSKRLNVDRFRQFGGFKI